MTERINVQARQPEAYTALFGLERYLASSTLEPLLMELVRARASQINGCVFCIGLHTGAAREKGEAEARLDALAEWRESPLFTDKEKAVLAVTEEVTRIADRGLSDAAYANVCKHLDPDQVAQLIVLIATTNAWNRIGVATRMGHEC